MFIYTFLPNLLINYNNCVDLLLIQVFCVCVCDKNLNINQLT